LRNTDLYKTNLQGAIFDYSFVPLHCGSFDMKADERLCAQLIAHITRIEWDANSEFCAEIMSLLDAHKNKFCEYRHDVDEI
jgi:hypothetical protein